jgi:signal transduction histidine kinase/CheY-like chemotaxis protein
MQAAISPPRRGLVRWAYVPIAGLVLLMAVLWAADLRESYVALGLTFVLQFVFMTLASGLIAYLVSRSFLAGGGIGLALLVCGILFWGLSGVVALAAGRGDFNISVTVHNLCIWLAGACHMTGALLSGRAARSSSQRGWWLFASYAATIGCVALVAHAARAGWTPTFFVQGEGGSLVRQTVLGTAIAMFVASAFLLGMKYRAAYSAFTHWYALGLTLTAAGLFGVMISTVHSSALNWTGVITQCLSGVYLLAAAIAAARESRAWEISLAGAPSDPRLRYALAVMFVAAAIALRMALLDILQTRHLTVTFFPAVILAALYGGRGPGLVAMLLSVAAIHAFGSAPAGRLGVGDLADWLVIALFIASSALIVWITDAVKQYQSRASAAEAANRAKDEFLAMLSHELRNPLAALSSAAHVLRLADPSGDAASKARRVVERQTKHMSRLIGDLLDVSRTSVGKLALDRERFDLGAAVAQLASVWRASGRFERHAVSVEAGPAWVDADRSRMDQIVANLLDNALKFTPAGKAVKLSVQQEDGAVTLRVADQGKGISPEAAARIFDLFVQEGPSGEGGLGIGLALVKQLTELHGGSVSVTRAGPGGGSVFTVRLPIAAPQAPAPKDAGHARATRSVLIVEDNDDARRMLEAALKLDGHEVRSAADAAGGLALAAAAAPDVALIDISLPDMDGYELARRLRAAPDGQRIGLVAVTGLGQPEDQRRARAAGFDAHLVKPVSAERLVQVMAQLR